MCFASDVLFTGCVPVHESRATGAAEPDEQVDVLYCAQRWEQVHTRILEALLQSGHLTQKHNIPSI